jgi:hypothetical protein
VSVEKRVPRPLQSAFARWSGLVETTSPRSPTARGHRPAPGLGPSRDLVVRLGRFSGEEGMGLAPLAMSEDGPH